MQCRLKSRTDIRAACHIATPFLAATRQSLVCRAHSGIIPNSGAAEKETPQHGPWLCCQWRCHCCNVQRSRHAIHCVRVHPSGLLCHDAGAHIHGSVAAGAQTGVRHAWPPWWLVTGTPMSCQWTLCHKVPHEQCPCKQAGWCVRLRGFAASLAGNK